MERVLLKEKSRSEIWQGDVLPEDTTVIVEYIHGGNMSVGWVDFVVLEYRKCSLVLSKRFSMSWLNI